MCSAYTSHAIDVYAKSVNLIQCFKHSKATLVLLWHTLGINTRVNWWYIYICSAAFCYRALLSTLDNMSNSQLTTIFLTRSMKTSPQMNVFGVICYVIVAAVISVMTRAYRTRYVYALEILHHRHVKILVRSVTGKGLTSRLTKLGLVTLTPSWKGGNSGPDRIHGSTHRQLTVLTFGDPVTYFSRSPQGR